MRYKMCIWTREGVAESGGRNPWQRTSPGIRTRSPQRTRSRRVTYLHVRTVSAVTDSVSRPASSSRTTSAATPQGSRCLPERSTCAYNAEDDTPCLLPATTVYAAPVRFVSATSELLKIDNDHTHPPTSPRTGPASDPTEILEVS